MNDFKFSSLIGNRSVISLITRSLANGTFPQVTVFHGVQGTGKSTCANNAAMALTCDNPINGQACLQCQVCRENMYAIKSSRKSRYMEIVNVPIDNSNAKMEELVTNIFKLEHGEKNTVYVVSEAHRLGEYQDALLTELDSMPENVYLILTTTKYNSLSVGMKSRVLDFAFQHITRKESRLLASMVARELGVVALNAEIENLILNRAKNVPRDIIKYTKFALENKASVEELEEFFGLVSDSELLMLFECMKSNNYSLLVETVSEMTQQHTSEAVISSMKDFLLRALFLVEGGIQETFDYDLIGRVTKLFDVKKLLRISDYVGELKEECDESTLAFALLKIRRALMDSNLVGTVQNAKVDAARNKEAANRLASDFKQATTVEGFTQATPDFLKNFAKKQQGVMRQQAPQQQVPQQVQQQAPQQQAEMNSFSEEG